MKNDIEKPVLNPSNSSCMMCEEATLAELGFDQSKINVSNEETDKIKKTDEKRDKSTR